MTNAPETKLCTKCNEEKPISDFHRDSASKDGHAGTCRECWSQYDKARGKTLHRKSQLALKDAKRSRRQVEQANGRTIEDTLTFLDVYWTLSEHECAYCGKETPEQDRTLDHILPLKHGGTNSFDNVTMACKSCNISKSDKPVYDYILRKQNIDATKQLVGLIASRKVTSYHDVLDEWERQATEYHVEQVKERLKRNVKRRHTKAS